jgi:hypothetical protein
MTQTRTRRHVCFASIIEGDLTTPERERCEAAFFEKLAAAHIPISMVAVNDVGCVFAIDEFDLQVLREAVGRLNVALNIHKHCARLSLSSTHQPYPPVSGVIAAMAEAGISIIHLAAGSNDLAILVEERDATRAQAVLASTVSRAA